MVKCKQCEATTETTNYLVSFKGGLILCCDCWEEMKKHVKKSVEENRKQKELIKNGKKR